MTTQRTEQIGPSKFRAAVHALAFLANRGTVVSSATLAAHIQSHATFLRRVMSALTQAGLVEAREGRDGGYLLKVPAHLITLADVHLALEPPHECEEHIGHLPSKACEQVVHDLDEQIIEVLKKTQVTVLDTLQMYTLEDLMTQG
ncbi:Rrf2 family protein [Aureibacillus halotolerans]|uniref:Rrf2 family protein n=1 Tax=Aureibacillus halotolerans TaxID=1508390 RepID=A0A4R6U806_9BACI|nr:Rrf2 family protein [Aureibacillus halotolerans]